MKRYAHYIIKLAREFRKNSTVTEKLLWAKLRNRNLDGLKFKRQYSIERYVVDFYCDELKLIVEVEGGIHDKLEQQIYDNERFRDLTLSGYQILRINNDEVLNNINGVLEKILQHKNLSPHPSPIRRGDKGLQPYQEVRLTLSGKTILITRSKEQSKDFIEAIESRGGKAILFPTIKITDPDDWHECDRALENLNSFDGIIFTSRNSVEKFIARMKIKNVALSALRSMLFFAVGEKTKSAIEKHNLKCFTIPETYTAEYLAEIIKTIGVQNKKFLFPRGNLGSDVIIDKLTDYGAEVKSVTVYKTEKAIPENLQLVEKELSAGNIDVVTFTSPSIVKNFFSLFSQEAKKGFIGKIIFAVIGEVTADALRKFGIEPAVTAKPSTIEGMVEGIKNYFTKKI